MSRSLIGYGLALACGALAGAAWTWTHAIAPPPSQAIVRHTGEAIADLTAAAAPAVVAIDTLSRARVESDDLGALFGMAPPERIQKGVGSGFLIDSEGLIVTNHHVVAGAEKLTVTLHDGRHFTGRVMGTDPATDLAVVRIPAHGLPTLAFAPKVRVGARVVAIGSPLGLSESVTSGIVSARDRDVELNSRVSFLQTDAAINPGNSGGPLLDLAGRVVGVNTAIARDANGIGFAIPSETVRRVVDELVHHGKVEHAWIGVSLQDSADGVRIAQVLAGGPAERSGLLPGDALLEADGKELQHSSELVRYLATKRSGERVRFKVGREGQRKILDLTLVPMPDSALAPTSESP